MVGRASAARSHPVAEDGRARLGRDHRPRSARRTRPRLRRPDRACSRRWAGACVRCRSWRPMAPSRRCARSAATSSSAVYLPRIAGGESVATVAVLEDERRGGAGRARHPCPDARQRDRPRGNEAVRPRRPERRPHSGGGARGRGREPVRDRRRHARPHRGAAGRGRCDQARGRGHARGGACAGERAGRRGGRGVADADAGARPA